MQFLKVPPYRQLPNTCGPTSLRMVLEYYGIKKTNEELVKLTHCTQKDGATSEAIISVAKKFGLKAFQKDFCTLKDLKKWYKKGVPVIVDWFDETDGHYSPLLKIDNKNVWLMDPQIAKPHRIDLDTFKLIWFDFLGTMVKSKNDFVIRRIIVIHR